jgi:hypothetical protein
MAENDQFIDSVKAATLSFRRRSRLGIAAISIGFALFSLSWVFGYLLYIITSVPGFVTEPAISKAGVFIIGLGVLGTTLINYLQLGVFLPREQQIASLLAGSLSLVSPNVATVSAPAVRSYISVARPQHAVPDDATEDQHFTTVNRLMGEIGDLGRRGNTALAIGILTTVVGVGILGYVVYIVGNSLGDFGWKEVVYTVLRISIALFIQTFAYFFLRLYKNSLEDIKYYQNEITNMESKWLALKAASDLKELSLINIAVESLTKTERNFILKKGESTLGMERERLEKNEMLDLMKETMATIVKLKPGK